MVVVAVGRSWAQQIQARYQMFNPDAARPARRIYIGGLPLETTDVRPHRPSTIPTSLSLFATISATRVSKSLLLSVCFVHCPSLTMQCVFASFQQDKKS